MTTTQIVYGQAGAQQARGTAVVIDVFRAFSTACYIIANGAARLIVVDSLDVARRLQAANPDIILVGERHGQPVSGFHFGNSPTAVEAENFTGRTVVHTTTNGTRGLLNATRASEVITGSFVNAGAIVRYLRQQQPDKVSLVAMGSTADWGAPEDNLCAEYLQAALAGEPPPFEEILAALRGDESSSRYFNDMFDWAPASDFELCLKLNRFDFVLKAEPEAVGQLSLRKIDV